jgi:[ribosomal protein S5]-alanine N-acetyltransferase
MNLVGRLPSRTGLWYVSPRLVLRPVPWEAVRAIAASRRLDGWAADYPSAGDVVIMDLLHRVGRAAWSGLDQAWGHRQVVERASGMVVGGIGFLGPPDLGEVEVGYGIVPSRQGRGYATEALCAMVTMAWAHLGVTAVVAGTERGNAASQRVLEKAGFQRAGAVAGQCRYRLSRPS